MRCPKFNTTVPARAMRQRRGFTLIELMVAITGGLLVSIVVFALARDATRFYKRESRIGDATLGVVLGFERLRADIARAGFLSSANVRNDPALCGTPGQLSGELGRLASVRITPNATTGNSVLDANGLSPDAIVLAGNYQSADQFPIWGVSSTASAGVQVFLQTRIGPLARKNYRNADNPGNPGKQAILDGLFPAQRVLRIVDESGRVQYGIISGVSAGQTPADNEPFITLTPQPTLVYRTVSTSVCGLKSNELGVVSVINFVRYGVTSLSGVDGYAALYDEALGAAPFDANRTELVRTELAATNEQDVTIADSQELVAERVVDLKFGLTVTDPAGLKTLLPGDEHIVDYAGDVAAAVRTPERVRAVRVRLSVRSMEPDRATDVEPDLADTGLYRIDLGTPGLRFARVRTLQADVALPNHTGP